MRLATVMWSLIPAKRKGQLQTRSSPGVVFALSKKKPMSFLFPEIKQVCLLIDVTGLKERNDCFAL